MRLGDPETEPWNPNEAERRSRLLEANPKIDESRCRMGWSIQKRLLLPYTLFGFHVCDYSFSEQYITFFIPLTQFPVVGRSKGVSSLGLMAGQVVCDRHWRR